jgi:hypothetical protein
MKIKIVSDGTSLGSKVVNTKTGEKIDGISRIELIIDAATGLDCTITAFDVDVDIDADTDVQKY